MWMKCRGGGYLQAKCVHVHIHKGLALPRASHSGEIALAGSRCLFSTRAVPFRTYYCQCHSSQKQYTRHPWVKSACLQ